LVSRVAAAEKMKAWVFYLLGGCRGRKRDRRPWVSLPTAVKKKQNGIPLWYVAGDDKKIGVPPWGGACCRLKGKKKKWGAEFLIFSQKRGIKWSWARGSGWFRVKKKSS
jgi:hypothetical protein